MKILSKIFFTVLIVVFAIVISIVPCFALPSVSDSGLYANYDFMLRPSVVTYHVGTSAYFLPSAPGTATVNSGSLYISSYHTTVSSSATTLTYTFDSGVVGSEFVDVYFEPLFIDFSDIRRCLSGASISYLDSLVIRGYAIDYSVDGRTDSFELVASINTSGYYNLGDVEFLNVRLGDLDTSGNPLDILSNYFSNGFDRLYISEVYLASSIISYSSSRLYTVGFNSPYRSSYYENFDFDSSSVTVVTEDINVVQWLYDVIEGLFNTTIFGDVSLGHLFLIVLCVPMLVAVFKSIAGG